MNGVRSWGSPAWRVFPHLWGEKYSSCEAVSQHNAESFLRVYGVWLFYGCEWLSPAS